ncbi:tyrosine kinase receptor Cad96Ca [Ixodes scapularis]
MRVLGACALALLGCVLSSVLQTGYSFPGQNTPPVFDFKREWVIGEDEKVGSRVMTVRTRDEDQDVIEYGLEPAVFLDGSSYFRINKRSGEVFLTRSLAGQAGSDYYLFITAYDGHQTAKIEVYVKVEKPSIGSEDGADGLDLPSPDGVPARPFPHRGPSGPPSAHFAPAPPPPSLGPKKRPPKDPPPIFGGELGRPAPRPGPGQVRPDAPVEDPADPAQKGGPAEGGGALGDGAGGTGGPATGLDMTATVLPIVAVVGFAPLVALFFWLMHRRCNRDEKLKPKKSTDRLDSNFSPNFDLSPTTLYNPRARRALSNRYEPDFLSSLSEHNKWEFPRHHLRFIGILGEGCFGQVWKCEAMNITGSEEPVIVAVKTLKENATEKEKKDLLSELGVMKLINPHPNVVTLLGSCTDRDPLFVIMEFVPYGKLQTYLRESRVERSYGNLHGSSKHLTSRDLTSFAYQVAKGMEYLSSKGIIHRDLAARNILVGESKTCKVADFGFARDVITNHVYERKSEGRLPIRWMAPESLYDNIFTAKTDVWSFGILMWEIVTLGSTPYPGLAAAEVMRRVREGYRLEKPEHCKREMYNIMYYCWDPDPKERPSFGEVTCLLDKLLVSENDYIELDRFPDHSYYNITNLSGEKL